MLAGGKWVLFRQGFTNKQSTGRLMRVPLGGGTPATVPIPGPLDEFACALRGSRCVLRQPEGEAFYVFYELDPLRGRGRELARTKWTQSVFGDWALSPDGQEIAMPVHDSNEARIRLITLDQKHGQREVVIPKFSNLNECVGGAEFLMLFARHLA